MKIKHWKKDPALLGGKSKKRRRSDDTKSNEVTEKRFSSYQCSSSESLDQQDNEDQNLEPLLALRPVAPSQAFQKSTLPLLSLPKVPQRSKSSSTYAKEEIGGIDSSDEKKMETPSVQSKKAKKTRAKFSVGSVVSVHHPGRGNIQVTIESVYIKEKAPCPLYNILEKRGKGTANETFIRHKNIRESSLSTIERKQGKRKHEQENTISKTNSQSPNTRQLSNQKYEKNRYSEKLKNLIAKGKYEDHSINDKSQMNTEFHQNSGYQASNNQHVHQDWSISSSQAKHSFNDHPSNPRYSRNSPFVNTAPKYKQIIYMNKFVPLKSVAQNITGPHGSRHRQLQRETNTNIKFIGEGFGLREKTLHPGKEINPVQKQGQKSHILITGHDQEEVNWSLKKVSDWIVNAVSSNDRHRLWKDLVAMNPCLRIFTNGYKKKLKQNMIAKGVINVGQAERSYSQSSNHSGSLDQMSKKAKTVPELVTVDDEHAGMWSPNDGTTSSCSDITLERKFHDERSLEQNSTRVKHISPKEESYDKNRYVLGTSACEGPENSSKDCDTQKERFQHKRKHKEYKEKKTSEEDRGPILCECENVTSSRVKKEMVESVNFNKFLSGFTEEYGCTNITLPPCQAKRAKFQIGNMASVKHPKRGMIQVKIEIISLDSTNYTPRYTVFEKKINDGDEVYFQHKNIREEELKMTGPPTIFDASSIRITGTKNEYPKSYSRDIINQVLPQSIPNVPEEGNSTCEFLQCEASGDTKA